MAQMNILEGFQTTIFQITSLITAYPPPFIYIHDPATPHLLATALRTALLDLQGSSDLHLRCASVDAVICFNQRLLFDTILNALAQWSPAWEEGSSNWNGLPADHGDRFNESFDTFVHGLRAVESSLRANVSYLNGKGKARDGESQREETRLVIFIERAQRLKDSMPDLLVPLTRISELVCGFRHIFAITWHEP